MDHDSDRTRSQRITARVVIALFAVFGLVVMGFPTLSFGSVALLQETESPTGSPTESPTESPSPTGTPPPSGVAIQFLNPSDHSDVVSTKDDGTNTTYHLVAVVREVPANATVEFKFQSGSDNEVSIGIASRVGSTDTFEFHWSLAGVADGSYTLRALLFSGTAEVSRDEIDVTVNSEDETLDPTAETVEIVAPPNGNPAGFFQPLGADSAHTVVDVTSSAELEFPSTSTGTDSIDVSYTKTFIGEEPEWISCGSAGRSSSGSNSIRCTLEEGDTPAQVTGLAAVANPAGSTFVPGSGDAHRVFPYNQIPSAVALDPASQPGKTPGECADVITATIRDQNGAKIAGVNTDVHAKGPTDNLLFDDSGNNSSAHQAPDAAHTDPESAWNCEGEGTNGEQGQHEFAPGNPDTKHIESTTGTNNAGQFLFQLFSPDGVGSTEIAVWADTDGDDLWCADEASGRGSIGWGPSPSPTPTESPSESPSPTGSPTGSPSPTSAPEPTTLGPDLATCPGPTASPTGPSANRTVSLSASKNKIKHRRRVRLSGMVEADNPSCEDNELIEIVQRIHGQNQFREFRTTATDGAGDFAVRFRPRRSADYRAVAPAADACDEASSSLATVRVRVKVTRGASRTRGVPRGARVKILGKVVPRHKGSRVVLQRKKGKKWTKVKATRVNRRGRYRFFVRANWNRRVFRVKWPGRQHADHITGLSRKIRIRTA